MLSKPPLDKQWFKERFMRAREYFAVFTNWERKACREDLLWPRMAAAA